MLGMSVWMTCLSEEPAELDETAESTFAPEDFLPSAVGLDSRSVGT